MTSLLYFPAFAASVVTRDDQESDTQPETHDKADGDKRALGRILSSGFKIGKKQQQSVGADFGEDMKQDFKRWYYGKVLGKGFKAGKRNSNEDDYGREIEDVKRDDDNVARDIEAVDLEGPTDDKRWNPDSWDTGYNYPLFRKKRDLDKRFIGYFGRGFTFRNRDRKDESKFDDHSDDSEDDLENPQDEPKFDENEDFENYEDFDPEMEASKRYIGTNPGYRFNFGKRPYNDLEYLDEIEKRGFGHVLGRGFAFGKREHRKRPFGYLLGKGLSFGKRAYEDESGMVPEIDGPYYLQNYDDDDMQKRMGLVLGRGFLMGKRGSKRFGWILGRGLKFGKRSGVGRLYESGPNEEEDFFDENGELDSLDDRIYAKRFGHILGSGFAFGKRYSKDFENGPEKRGFGYMLGRGFRLGKR